MSAVMAAEQYFRNIFFNPAQFIDGFIYVSNFAKNIQEKYMPAVKNKSNIILYNFSTSIVQKGENIPKNKYFLFFGRLSYEKGVKTLLSAFKEIPECKLKVVGTGPKEEELKQYVEETYMQNVDFLGYKQGKELTDLVSNAYFVIVPSEWYENNPMTIIEAYSVGTPVIGAQIGGIPEIVIDGKTGFQFTSADTKNLRNIILKANKLNNEEYATMSSNTIKFANENLSPQSYWEKLIEFYTQFIKSEQ